MRPTPLGWKAAAFYVALVGAFLAAPYNNLFFLLIAFLGALGSVGALLAWRNAAGATGSVEELEPVPAGAGGTWRACVDARGRLRIGMRAVVRLRRAGRTHTMTTSDGLAVPGPLPTIVEGTAPPLPRGVYEVAAAWIETDFPLGLLRVRRRATAPRDLVVHPLPADLPAARGAGDLVAELGGVLAGEAGAAQPSSLRAFHDGDDPRKIHWRATARRGALVVKEWEAECGAGLEIVLDRRVSAETLEDALSTVAAVALAARDEKERLTFHTQGSTRTYGAGHAPFRELLALLAEASPVPGDGPPPPAAGRSVLRLPRTPERTR